MKKHTFHKEVTISGSLNGNVTVPTLYINRINCIKVNHDDFQESEGFATISNLDVSF